MSEKFFTSRCREFIGDSPSVCDSFSCNTRRYKTQFPTWRTPLNRQRLSKSTPQICRVNAALAHPVVNVRSKSKSPTSDVNIQHKTTQGQNNRVDLCDVCIIYIERTSLIYINE